MSLNVTKTYFMLMVTDMDRATSFYRDGLGLQEVFGSPYWTELSAAGATVALHLGGPVDPGAEPRWAGLGFEVDDLELAVELVEGHGGRVVRAPTDRPDEGIRLAEVADPEGNQISIAKPTR